MKLNTILLLAAALVCHVTDASLTIGAFNIQRLSNNKANNATILKEIATILVRFDVVSIEEVIHDTAMHTVLQEVNRLGGPYSVTMSPQLGRTSYKEHLAILYRSDKLTLVKTHLFADLSDVFEREPYTAHFHTTHAGLSDFGLMGVHLKPADVLNEMNALVHAYTDASHDLGVQSILIAGDYNADCRYLSTTIYHQTDLWTDSRFYFLVTADADTTASHNTDCAYDRFVATGQLRGAVVAGSVQVYNFETGMHLSYADALAISDHYPVQLTLQ